MEVCFVKAATKEELESYRKYKEECRLEALSDKEKQTRKKVKAISALGEIRVGICPTCEHCLI